MRWLIIFSLMVAAAASATDWQQFSLDTQHPTLALNQQDADSVIKSTSTVVQKKSAKAAVFMSALVPGAGQIYAKSWLKGAAFIALEAAAWTFYAINTQEGNEIRDEFHAYANEHWSETAYFQWLSYHSGIEYTQANVDALRDWEHNHFSHGLHVNKDQQYYEMIGKYHQFNWGWDDFREEYDISMTHNEMTVDFLVSENRYYYESRRDAHNEALKRATTFTTLAMLNHILSAVDAAWTTHKYNQQVTLGLRVEPMQYDRSIETALTLRVNW